MSAGEGFGRRQSGEYARLHRVSSLGGLPLDKISAAIKPIDDHFARTRLLALENSIGGKVLPAQYVAEATGLARERKLSPKANGRKSARLGPSARFGG